MSDDPSSLPASDTTPNVSSEVPNRPEPIVETPVSASESANTQPEQPQSANTSSESAGTPQEQPQPAADQHPTSNDELPEAPPTHEPPQAPETTSEEPVSIMSTSPQIDPSVSGPPAQEVPPEIEPVKKENQPVQAATEPQSQREPEAPQPQNLPPIPSEAPVSPQSPISPQLSIPFLHYPFFGNYPVTFDFGAEPSDERIKKKYEEWGIVGHNGIDFGLQEGTEVITCDEGTVMEAGDNGDHGISVTTKHSWGTSIYSHLQSLGVLVNDQVKKAQVIGSSGQTGFTTGPHLHFGIQPTNPDTNNGYLGYINPMSYLSEQSEKPQSKPQPQEEKSSDLSEEKPEEETPINPAKQSEPKPPQSPLPAEASAQEGISPQSPQPPQVPQSEPSQEDIQKQAVAMFDARIKENSIKGNQAKKAKRDEAIQKIFAFAQEKKRITNEQIRDLLHISQSTATDYLSDLVNRGMLKTEGKGRATIYLF